ncbi:hypothetical protein UY3_13374 [Chelonia mydas]|uniref:Myb/SANT-like DNA-binding domain-containing protein n=1 Tax=Chelonia mydas TaxID=8469 RepID=M7AXM5_CHEMY|nr:hypothetical protein UY3_13374 [Chelonia mydas]
MPTPHTRRPPAWSNAELLALISIWGEEAIQSELRSSHRNYDTYGQVSQCMTERVHDRDTLQCRVKVKELWNTYHKSSTADSQYPLHSTPIPLQFNPVEVQYPLHCPPKEKNPVGAATNIIMSPKDSPLSCSVSDLKRVIWESKNHQASA